MKKIIITLCLTVAAVTAAAQAPLSFHAKAGIGTSNFYGKHSGSETMMAYKVGAGVEYELNKTWALQSALEFVSIGGKKEVDYGAARATMHEFYLQLPVMMAARLPLGENYHASLAAGPYIACGVGGKTSGKVTNYSSSAYDDSYRFRIDTFGSMAHNNMGNKRFDAGIAMAINFEYHRFIIGAEAQVGLVRVNEQLRIMYEQEGLGNFLPRNLATFFSVGYKF
ncbi:MAG: PorT family protein [Bacteroides sp.]|nr:PorT family protein [Bacteroides sp.]